MSPVLVLIALVGNAIAVGVFCATLLGGVPLLMALPGDRYVHAHGFLATRYDPFMPVTIIVTALADIVLAAGGSGSAGRTLGGIAGLLLSSVITVSLTKNVPINRWIVTQDPQELPIGWSEQRGRWRRWNAIRSGLAMAALAANISAAAVIIA